MRQNRRQIGFVSICTLALLLAAGCTGTDFLDNGNSTVAFEIVAVGSSNISKVYDCVQWRFGDLVIRPLDGTCGPTSINPGAACFKVSDCPPLVEDEPGTCDNSSAAELVEGDGIFVKAGDIPGNILGGDCNPTIDAGGKCEGLVPQVLCVDDSDCGFCEQNPNPPCSTDADCGGPNDLCTGQAPCVNQFGIFGSALIPPESLILSAGVYEVGTLRVGLLGLYEDVPDPARPAGGPYFRGCGQIAINVTDSFGDALRFTVSEKQSKMVRFEVDIGTLEENLPAVDDCGDPNTGLIGNITSILECVSCDAAP